MILLLAPSCLPAQLVVHFDTTARTIWHGGDRLPNALVVPSVQHHVVWRSAGIGMQWAEIDLSAGPTRVRVRAAVVRLDPRHFRFELQQRFQRDGHSPDWTIEHVDNHVAFAINAGHFTEAGPWGWLIRNSRTQQNPGRGPLVTAIASDSTGSVSWLAEPRAGPWRWAFQSYPLLLREGGFPGMVDGSVDGLDRRHRDARAIMCRDAAGSLTFMLTRFNALGPLLSRVPIGLTVQESAVFAAAMGCVDAVMLDGGLSGQMMVRDQNGRRADWAGLRKVPLGLVAMRYEPDDDPPPPPAREH